MEDLDALLTVARETIHKTEGFTDLPGQIWSRMNVNLDHKQGGHSHAQESVHAGRDYSTSADG